MMRSPRAPAGRAVPRGFVLVIVLLLLLALTALAHAALVTARAHRRAGGLVGLARSRQWAATALAVDAGRTLDSLRGGAAAPPALPGGEARTTLIGLSAELALLEARVDSAGAGAEAGALVWALDPATRVAALPAIAEVGRWPDPYTEATLAAGETEVCPPEAVAPGGGPFLRSLAASTETDPLALGRLSRVDLLDRLEPLDAAGGTPAPVDELGACLAGTWNWGALEPGDPCRGRRVALVRSGDLRLEGGEGQGVLAVAGSLELVGTRFRGLLLVEGDVRLDGGAEVEGVARVGGSLLIASGRWTSGPCAAYRALAAASPLRRPLLLPGAGWALF